MTAHIALAASIVASHFQTTAHADQYSPPLFNLCGIDIMADLVEIAFPSEEKAEQVRQKLLDMQNEYLIELADAVIAVKQPNGRIKLNQLFNLTGAGALSGTRNNEGWR
jgi:hypothetical protein